MIKDDLKRKILVLSEKAWERKVIWPEVESWLENFRGIHTNVEDEKLHALYLLTQTMYFSQELIREMLRSIFDDLYRYPIISKIREENNDTLDEGIIEKGFIEALKNTRFLGVGNPSESGPHLLYYFRQINSLPKDIFIDSSEILSISRNDQDNVVISQKDTTVERYVFIDDLLGSGDQVKSYLDDIIRELRKCAPNSEIYYFSLFATSSGLVEARKPDFFDNKAESIYELDATFKCFDKSSRCFINKPSEINQNTALEIAKKYGQGLGLESRDHLGYKDGQLLLALSHNTPDNSLPILWFDFPKNVPWTPIFKRYIKQY